MPTPFHRNLPYEQQSIRICRHCLHTKVRSGVGFLFLAVNALCLKKAQSDKKITIWVRRNAAAVDDDLQASYEPLTDREREILGLIAEGRSNQEIADQLYLSLDTVKWYNSHMYQKLDVRSRVQAVARARELALLDDAPSPAKYQLPEQNSLFIGRKNELEHIQARLAQPDCRLLTLVGPGGVGKTRLALEAARQQRQHFSDGACFVSLASVDLPEFLVKALVTALGLGQTTQRDLREQVFNYVRSKQFLLLVDNFEHLLAGVDLLGDLLAQSEGLKLLVTSRERLRLKEEWIFDVQGLHYPGVGPVGQAEVDPVTYEAGQLFLLTAQRTKSDFEPDAQDQQYIARICQLVGGMPLGIELAASWVRLLSCAEIAREIEQDLDILKTAWRDVPERHRSIQTVLDHSWKLLTEDEQEAFRKLAVFQDVFGRDAAQDVANAALRLLLALVDKSFLQRADDDHFGIHELLKQYGSSKLRADPEVWIETHLRHCRYHAGLLYERMTRADASLVAG